MTASRTGWIPAIIAGIIATTISCAGPLVIIFQAAQGLEPSLVISAASPSGMTLAGLGSAFWA